MSDRTPAQEERDAIDEKLRKKFDDMTPQGKSEVMRNLAIFELSGNDWITSYLAAGIGRFTASALKTSSDYKMMKVQVFEQIKAKRQPLIMLDRDGNDDRVFFRNDAVVNGVQYRAHEETPGTFLRIQRPSQMRRRTEENETNNPTTKPFSEKSIEEMVNDLGQLYEQADLGKPNLKRQIILDTIKVMEKRGNETESQLKQRLTQRGIDIVRKAEQQLEQYRNYKGTGEKVEFGDIKVEDDEVEEDA